MVTYFAHKIHRYLTNNDRKIQKYMTVDFCFLCNSPKPGGGNRVIYEICQQIQNCSNYSCEILFIDGRGFNKEFSKVSNLKFRQAGITGNSKLTYIVNLILSPIYILLFHWRYRFIVVSSPILSPLVGIIPIGKKYSYIQADDYIIFDERLDGITLIIYKFITKYLSYTIYGNNYFFNSYFTYLRFRNILPRKNEILQFNSIVPGVDLSIFTPKNRTQTSGKQIFLEKGDKVTVSTVLRKQAWKRSVDFITAAENIFRDGNSNIAFIGITNEDLSSLDVPDFITVCRPASDIELAHVLQESDIFISTSLWEGFGLPALEAMACGCAVISSDNGGCREYAVDGHNCLLYSPGDVDHLRSLIVKLSADEDLRTFLVENGLSTSLRFNWSHSVDALIKAIKN